MSTPSLRKKLVELLSQPRKLTELSQLLAIQPRRLLSIITSGDLDVCYVYELDDALFDSITQHSFSKNQLYSIINSSIVLYSSNALNRLSELIRKLRICIARELKQSFWIKIAVKRVERSNGMQIMVIYNSLRNLVYVVTRCLAKELKDLESALNAIQNIVPIQNIEMLHVTIPTLYGTIKLKYRCRFTPTSLRISLMNAMCIAILLNMMRERTC
ncbi:MAG TPA: hypothetical protein EYP48_00750 [Ignisphaera sp.]|nr:hypothetical protein [Ignisphaera sp.]